MLTIETTKSMMLTNLATEMDTDSGSIFDALKSLRPSWIAGYHNDEMLNDMAHFTR